MTRKLGMLSAAQRRRLQIEAVRLREAGLDYAQIALSLDIMAIGARDLCMRHCRLAKQYSKLCAARPLPPRMIALLLKGRYANVVASTRNGQMRRIAEIATHYTRSELLMEPGIGRATLDRVERWLAVQGRRLRASAQPTHDVIGGSDRNQRELSVRAPPVRGHPAAESMQQAVDSVLDR